ncbi:MAG: TIGR03790 family protein, partial [Terriglobales bacterium]
DRSNHSRFLNHTWVNGALLAEFVSTDARTFERPPKNWNIGKWSDPPGSFFEGSPQSLIGDYIHEGVTGVAGHVYEPYLGACPRPQILFPAYVRGLNLAESFYAAMPLLSWQTVVVGDPLTAPFPRDPLPRAEADPPKDAATGLPKYFAGFAARAEKRPTKKLRELTPN